MDFSFVEEWQLLSFETKGKGHTLKLIEIDG
jgi:hypothetical protein